MTSNIDLGKLREIPDKQDDLRTTDFGEYPEDVARPTGATDSRKRKRSVERPSWLGPARKM